MKETFDIPNADLLRLSITLKEHKPYIVLSVNSTGINNKDFQDNQPIRMYMQEFVYDEDRQEYTRGMTFDKLIKCSPEALANAIKNESNFDVFEYSGVNKDDYINGINVLDVSDFKTAFFAFIDGTAEDTLFIANGLPFCTGMLESIDCADKLYDLVRNQQVLDQRALTIAYFKQHTISPKKTTLEALNDVLHKFEEGHTEKINGTENRVRVISDFVDRYGVEQGYLIPENENSARMTSTLFQDMQAAGRKKYLNADLDAKFDMLINNPKQALAPECKDRNFDCDLNRLYDILDGKTGAKGIVFFQAGTTGFKADNMPIQFSAVLCELREGRLVATKQQYFDIRTENRAIQKALDLKNKGEFDAFAYTGIDIDAYFEGYQTDPSGVKSTKPQKDKDAAANTINRFFEKYPPSEYPLVTNGRGRDGRSFSQTALSQMANISILNTPYIDFTQVIKEYSYVAHYDSQYPCNVLLNEQKGVKNFSLAEVGQHQAELKGKPVEEVYSENCHSLKKCRFVVDMINQICKQHNEMMYGSPEQQVEQNAPEKDVSPVEPDMASAATNNVSISEQSKDDVTSILKNINSILGDDLSKTIQSGEDINPTVDEAHFIDEGYSNIVENISTVEGSSALSAEQNTIDNHTISRNAEQQLVFSRQPINEVPKPQRELKPVEQSDEKERTRPALETQPAQSQNPTAVDDAERSAQSVSSPSETTVHNTGIPNNEILQKVQPTNGVTPDIAALISAMTAQTVAYQAQTAAYQAQMEVMNRQMSALIDQNNALIGYMAAQNKALLLTLDSTIDALSQNTDMEQGSEKSPIERLEDVKDTIANMFSEVPAPSKAYLQSANSMISKGQTEIDKTAEQKDNPSKIN